MKNITKVSASLASLIAASSANATIQYFGSSSFTVGNGSTSGTYGNPWDVTGEGDNAFYLNFTLAGQDMSIFGTSPENGRLVVDGSNRLFKLASIGVDVGASANFGNSVQIFDGGALAALGPVGFTENSPGYIGFSFVSGGDTLYGWASVTYKLNDPTYPTFSVGSWAYEDSGAAIRVGQTSSPAAVPEPSTYAAGLGLIALGAAGLRRWRKQKQVAA